MASILAVGAHPDDIEVGCFGTLLKHKKSGDDVHIAVTTKGGYGNRSWEEIQLEMKAAQAILGTEYVILDNPIGHYSMSWKTVSEIDELIKRFKVDTVYTVWHGDSHQDHKMTFNNVIAACRTQAIRNLCCFELPRYSYRSQEVFQARKFVDITPHMEDKLKAVMAYKSYFNDADREAIKGLASHRGSACGVAYAEGFEIIFEIWK